eukprot:gene1810-4910_t
MVIKTVVADGITFTSSKKHSLSALIFFGLPTCGALAVPGAIITALACGCTMVNPSRKNICGMVIPVSTLLGCAFSVGHYMFLETERFYAAGGFIMSLATFHCTEYIMTSLFNPEFLSFDFSKIIAFLLNHSPEYHAAMAAAVFEHAIHMYFFPSWQNPFCFKLGAVMCILGDTLRKSAMITAASNFKHIVATERNPSHQLVTHGVYRICRHPSYTGWLIWSIGTQILLSNTVCAVGFMFASYSFFKDRIVYEEAYLYRFFGKEYSSYRSQTWSGIPFVP